MTAPNLHALVGVVAVTAALVLLFVMLSAGYGMLAFILPAGILILASWWVLARRPRI